MKKTYETPKLTTHGDIRTLTQGTKVSGSTEGIWLKKPDPTS